MDINIEEYIRSNFKNSSRDEIKSSIIESVNTKDEIVLPGMGVFFDILWSNGDDQLKDTILDILHTNLSN